MSNKNNVNNKVRAIRQQTRAACEQGERAIRLTNKVQATNSKQGTKVKVKKQTRVAR
jgi:hypothetical protein